MANRLISGCLTGILTVLAASAVAAPLDQELRGLVDSSPQISAGRNTVSASEEQIDQAFAGFLPKVNVIGDAGGEYVDSPARRQLQGEPYTRSRETASIIATQLLYDGGLTSSNYQTAQLQNQAATLQFDSTSQNVLFDGINAYIGVLRQMELLKLARANERNIMAQLNLESERVERGSGIAVDVLQAKSRLQLAKERRIAIEGALKAAIATYEQVFGHPPELKEMDAAGVPLGLVPKAPKEVVEVALQENPAITSASVQSDVAAQQRDAVESEYFPTITLETAANFENNKNTVVGERRDVTVLVKANWNLFNGFATRAGVAKAAFDYAASRDNEQYVRRKVEEQAKIAWQALDTARQRVTLLQNAVNIASEVLVSRQKLRAAGKETAINVLDAENETYNARINLASATFDAKVAAYQVLLAMGRLNLDSVTTALKADKGEKLARAVSD